MEDLKKHPSNIAQAAYQYLQTVEGSEKTKRLYATVFDYFISSLKNDPSAVKEAPDGSYVLIHNWDVYYGGIFSGFLNWYMTRKVIGADTVQARAPGILRKWVQWCFEHKYFDQEHYEDYLDALPVGKSNDLKRIQKLSRLIGDIHEELDADELDSDDYEEGYFHFIEGNDQFGQFKNEDGRVVGPVKLNSKITKLFKKGDAAYLTLDRDGKFWKVTGSGNVYPEGTIYP